MKKMVTPNPKSSSVSLSSPSSSPLLPPSLPFSTKLKLHLNYYFIIQFGRLYMGTGFSIFSRGITSTIPGPSLGDLPEGCISSILMHLSPPEICKLAQMNRAFHTASSADFVWEPKLPSNYKFLADKILIDHEDLPKKDIYAKLCKPNRFDVSTKEVWLDKNSGQVCVCISSKALRITGIDDRRYWTNISSQESRFHTVAYLQRFWWVEALGELEFEFPPGSYSLFFRLQLGKTCTTKSFGRQACDVDQVHGWHIKPVQFELTTSDGQHALSECYLREQGRWIHYHVGDFIVQSPNPFKIKWSMVQIVCTHTKGGLSLDCVLIYPSKFKEKLIKYA